MSTRGEPTRRGIAEARARGVTWGTGGRERADKNRAVATAFAESMRPLFIDLMLTGRGNASRLAARLNERGVPTAGGGRWHAATVARILKRLNPLLAEEVSKLKKTMSMNEIQAAAFAIVDQQLKDLHAAKAATCPPGP